MEGVANDDMRNRRWLRRLPRGLVLATVVGIGATPARAKLDEGTPAPRYVVAGGWSGQVDAETGIPLSAAIPERGDLPVAFRPSTTGQTSAAAESQRPSPVATDSSSSRAWREGLTFGIVAMSSRSPSGSWSDSFAGRESPGSSIHGRSEAGSAEPASLVRRLPGSNSIQREENCRRLRPAGRQGSRTEEESHASQKDSLVPPPRSRFAFARSPLPRRPRSTRVATRRPPRR